MVTNVAFGDSSCWSTAPPSPHLTSLVCQSCSTFLWFPDNLYQLGTSSRGIWGLGQRLVKPAVPPGGDGSGNHSLHSSQAGAVLPRALHAGETPGLQAELDCSLWSDVWLELYWSYLYWFLLCYSSLLIRMFPSNPEQSSSCWGCRWGRWGVWYHDQCWSKGKMPVFFFILHGLERSYLDKELSQPCLALAFLGLPNCATRTNCFCKVGPALGHWPAIFWSPFIQVLKQTTEE